MRLRRTIAALVGVAIGTIMFAPLAAADGGGGAATDGDGIDYGAISGGQQPGAPASGGHGGGSSPPTNCTYSLVELEAGSPIYDLDGNLSLNNVDCSGIDQPDMGGLVCLGANVFALQAGAALIIAALAALLGGAFPG